MKIHSPKMKKKYLAKFFDNNQLKGESMRFILKTYALDSPEELAGKTNPQIYQLSYRSMINNFWSVRRTESESEFRTSLPIDCIF